ncbi:MAG: NAD(P)/FAD-dependent oxidoreductase [Aggregatilineales bacterium]
MASTTSTPHLAIIGGGIMGLTLAYRLSQQGIKVTLYERSDNPGGLASFFMVNGARVDRFYHTILSSDTSMHALIQETGVADKLHFTETKQGFYDNGKLYPFNTPRDLMLYPPLNLFQRFRLGLQVIYAQFESDWRKIDQIPVKNWLIRVSGRGVYEKVWAPLLRAKFDTTASDVPATYIWSRLRRMMGTRQGVTSKEMMCYLENGYYTLIEAMAAHCEQLGVEICLNTAVQEIAIENGRAVGVRINNVLMAYSAVISTVPSPILKSLIPAAPDTFGDLLAKQEYLGVICPLLILKESLMPYYVLNITDPSIPFTAVVETTRLIDPQYVKGQHLVYLPKYIAPDNAMAKWSDEQIKGEWMTHFKRMFPAFDERLISDFIVQRARYVEAIRPLGTLDQIPPIKTPVTGLYMGNTVMFYPDLGNGEAVTRFAQKVADVVVNDRVRWESELSPTPAIASV